MGYTVLNVTAPHATAYDADYPTRSTENYSHQLHEILQDMEDAAGIWYIQDDYVNSSTDLGVLSGYVHDMIEEVFDYAEGAIDTYRATGTPVLSKPTKTTVTIQTSLYTDWAKTLMECYASCMKVCYLVYYMWKTEEDPLLLKEKLQELLVAWPLLDTTIELQNDMGQSFKVYPSWKNCDLDL